MDKFQDNFRGQSLITSNDMSISCPQTNWFIGKGLIYTSDYPSRGCPLILPYGCQILERIEDQFKSYLRSIPYLPVDYPEIIPEKYAVHQKKYNLFEVKRGDFCGILCGSSEFQAAFTAKHLIHSYRDLPIHLYSKTKVRRDVRPISLLRDIEFTYFEINSFFEDVREAHNNVILLNELALSFFRSIDIPVLPLKRNVHNDSPRIIYSYLPQSGAFLSLFWNSCIGTKYTSLTRSRVHKKSNIFGLLCQNNAGFTGRVLATYLAHRATRFGLALHSGISPYDILKVVRRDDHESLFDANNILNALGFKCLCRTFKSFKQALDFHRASGIPIMVYEQTNNFLIMRHSDTHPIVVTKEALVEHVKSATLDCQPNFADDICIKKFQGDSLLSGNVVYRVEANHHKQAENLNLKFLGYFDDNSAAYVDHLL